MTIPNWGRVTPSQMFMLMLAGHVLRRYLVPPDIVEPDGDRIEAMKEGRELLRGLTGEDFGDDLPRWHAFLISGKDEWGYRHPYAWRTVRPAIERAMGDQDRLRLVWMLEGSYSLGREDPH
jgi:hypothetical protein